VIGKSRGRQAFGGGIMSAINFDIVMERPPVSSSLIWRITLRYQGR
jgi:hypothetical protein